MTPSQWRISVGASILAGCLVLPAGAALALADSGSGPKGDGPSAAAPSADRARQPGAAASVHAKPSDPRRGVVDDHPVPPPASSVPPGRTTTAAIVQRRMATADADADTVDSSDGPTAVIHTPQPTADQEPAAPTEIAAPDETTAPAPSADDPSPTSVQRDPPASPTVEPPPTVDTVSPTQAEAAPNHGTSPQEEPVPSPDLPAGGQEVTPSVPATPDVEPTPPPTVDVAPPIAAPPTAVGPARSRSGGAVLSTMQMIRLFTGGSWFSSGNPTAASASREFDVPSLLVVSPSQWGRTSPVALASTTTESPQVASATGAMLPQSLRVFFHTYGHLVIAASLSAVAAAALPGLVGMAIPALAGIRIGYRQAKAARSVGASGIVRFAGSGPIGVVRSGSRVALRSRGTRPGAEVTAERVA